MTWAETEPRQVPTIPAALAGLLEALEEQAIAWSLLRPSDSLQAAEGDVDLMVDPRAFPAACEILARLDFLPMPLPGPDLHAVAYDEQAGHFVWVHVQTALRLAGAVIPAEAVLAEAGGRMPRQPSDAWLLWILLLRALVDKGELPERHRSHVKALAQTWRGGPPALESVARRHRLEPKAIVGLAREGDWQALLGHTVHRPHTRAAAHRRVIGSAGRVLRAPARVRGSRTRRGLGVAIIGPDGAGKTTLVEGLRQSLPLETRVLYMGLTGGRLPKADALRIPGLVLAARATILWTRFAYASYHRARGRIVLFDRYTLDGAVAPGARLGGGALISRRIQRHICPLPELVLLLDASGETMQARSGEYDPAVLESWRAAYRRLRSSVPVLEIIDAEQPVELVRRQAEARIWRRYGEVLDAVPGRRAAR